MPAQGHLRYFGMTAAARTLTSKPSQRGWYYNALKSSGTSPNFRNTVASLKSPALDRSCLNEIAMHHFDR
jgi:hypothetical protein